ncbi:hypothetical protein JCM5296_007223 [Sporobolomyces johnsonii]
MRKSKARNDSPRATKLIRYARAGSLSYEQIQFTETLTLVRGLETVLDLGVVCRLSRYLACTDSSPAIYTLDSGAAADTPFLPLRSLTLRVYALAAARQFDFCATHVAGKDNTLADILSRRPVTKLVHDYGPSSDLFQFSPSMPLLQGLPL